MMKRSVVHDSRDGVVTWPGAACQAPRRNDLYPEISFLADRAVAAFVGASPIPLNRPRIKVLVCQ